MNFLHYEVATNRGDSIRASLCRQRYKRHRAGNAANVIMMDDVNFE
jgi:hypothetical protein